MNAVVKEFMLLCERVKIREKNTYGYDQIEDLLVSTLLFIKKHNKYKEMFIDFFCKKINDDGDDGLVYGDYNYLIQVIQFCMRDLQWLEIEEAAKKRKIRSNDWRIVGVMDQILEVYNVDWPDDDLYQYYSK